MFTKKPVVKYWLYIKKLNIHINIMYVSAYI